MKSKKGFTLVELVIVIAVLAILAFIAVPVVSQTINTATLNTAISDAKTLEKQLKLAKAAVDIGNEKAYGVAADEGTLTIGEVVTHQAIGDACVPSVYYSREVVPVWDQNISKVVLMYTDDNTNVETGAEITDFVKLTEDSFDVEVVTLK